MSWNTSLKRGRTAEYEDERVHQPKKSQNELQAEHDLREFLIDEFMAGGLNNTQVARIAELHQGNGGTGCEKLNEASSTHRARSVAKKYLQAVTFLQGC